MELKKLKITETGFHTMTGLLGDIEFIDGVSAYPLTPNQAARICSAMRAEFIDGTNSSPAALLVSERDVRAPVVDKLPIADKIAELKPLTGVDKYLIRQKENSAKPKYTQEGLEFIADEDGIGALRTIGKQYDVKATSIPKLIQAILQAQR